MQGQIKVKEFPSSKPSEDKHVDQAINTWLTENSVHVIDIKYSANNFGSHALVVYMDRG